MRQVVGNRELASKVRRSVQSGKQITATVIETYFDKVTVQLVGNGQLLRNLPIIGGPVEVGDTVKVDFSTTPPQVVATGKTFLTSDDLDNALKRLGDSTISNEAQISIVLFSGGASLDMYPATADGLTSALTAAGDGDVIWLPDVEIASNFALPDGVTLSGVSSRQSIIKGTITMGNNCTLENMKVVKTTWTNGTDVLAIDMQATTQEAYIKNCEIHSYHCATGDAYAIEVVADGLLQVDQSSIIAATGGGSAYAVKGNGGSYAKVTHCRIYALTEWFYNDGSYDVYSNVDGSSELEWWCVIDPTYRYTLASGFGHVSASDYNYTKVVKKPSTPTSALIGSTTYTYPGTVSRINDYIYLNLGAVIREYNITNGNTVDITMANATKYVVVEERKVVAIGRVPGKYQVKYLEFDNNSTSVLYEWDEDEGDYESDTIWNGVVEYGLSVTQENGDLIIVFIGICIQWVASINNEYYGIYYMVKNWTQGTDWVKINAFPADNPTDNRYTDPIYLYFPPAVVQDRYVCMVPSYSLSNASLADGSQWDTVNNKTIIIFPVLDLTTNTVSIAKLENSPRYGSFPDPDWYWRGIDHANQKIFAQAYDDGITNDPGIFRIYKFDPVAMSISVHATLPYTVDAYFVYNRNKSYYLVQSSSSDVDFYDANTNSARATNFNPGTYLYYPMDSVMDDNNNRAWVFKNNGDIVGVNPETGSIVSFASGVAPGATRTYFWALGDVFVVWRYQSGGTQEFHIVKE